jgi:ubiquinone/menaquinone biosynthesis C-methylase UbiE
MDSFHHIPNQETVLKEFFRVLEPGGLVILSEPGPNHSRTDQAQYEMLNFKVIEGDIIIEEIENIAKKIGFESIEVAVYNPIPTFYSVDSFNDLISNDEWTLAQLTKNYCSNHRLIRMKKPA